MITKIFISRAKISADGARYRVTRENGSALIESSRSPEFDACRALLAEGVTGRLEVWRPGKSSPDMVLDIERGSRSTVSEASKDGPVFRKWQPFAPGAIKQVEEVG